MIQLQMLNRKSLKLHRQQNLRKRLFESEIQGFVSRSISGYCRFSSFALSNTSSNKQVPDVTGKTVAEAREAIEKVNLKVGEEIEAENSDEVASGMII